MSAPETTPDHVRPPLAPGSADRLDTGTEGEGTWIPAGAAVPATLSPEIALARALAVQDPETFFDPGTGLRFIQALSPHTRRAYRSDWLAFLECCKGFGRFPLPATSAALEGFIEWRSPEQEHLARSGMYKFVPAGAPRRPVASSSLRRAVSAIAAVHSWLEYPDPTRAQSVRDTLKINTRNRRVQSQKEPLRWAHLERAYAHMGSNLWALRDKALSAVGFSTLLRRSELVALTTDDYHREPNQDIGRMAVGKTKSDDPKDLKYRPVVPQAVQHLEAWLRAAGIKSGSLFRGITPDARVQPNALSAGQVARAFKSIARLIELDEERIAGHSTRIGAAVDLRESGCTTLDIQHAGGWETEQMVTRYTQQYASDHSAMARMMRDRARTDV